MGFVVLLADTVVVEVGLTRGFDKQSELTLHRDLPHGLSPIMQDLSTAGNTPEVTAICLAIALVLLFYRYFYPATLAVVGPGGAALLADLGKHIFQRPRPHLWSGAQVIHSYSYPSGHATGSAALAVTVIWLAHRFFTSFGLRALLTILVTAFALGVGLSRIFLGVHWPTDVIGGYTLSIAWVTLVALFIEARIAQGTREHSWSRRVEMQG